MHIPSGNAWGDERPPGRDPEVQAAADDCQWLLIPLRVGQPGEFLGGQLSSLPRVCEYDVKQLLFLPAVGKTREESL